MAISEVLTQCDSCDGAGVKDAIPGPEGDAVVCSRCAGSGMRIIAFTPFTGRVKSSKYKRVIPAATSHVGLGVGNPNQAISYEEFWEGKMP